MYKNEYPTLFVTFVMKFFVVRIKYNSYCKLLGINHIKFRSEFILAHSIVAVFYKKIVQEALK